jgi:hypothetical protein
VCCSEVLVGFKICVNLICDLFCVLCAVLRLSGIFRAHLNVGKILVTFNNMGFTIYAMCVLSSPGMQFQCSIFSTPKSGDSA